MLFQNYCRLNIFVLNHIKILVSFYSK